MEVVMVVDIKRHVTAGVARINAFGIVVLIVCVLHNI